MKWTSSLIGRLFFVGPRRPRALCAPILALLALTGCSSQKTLQFNPLADELRGTTCQIIKDSVQIPHISADSDERVTACLGFQTAKDRAWQMDFLRRIAQGRQSEVIGIGGLRSDVAMRLFDFESRAGQIFSQMSEPTRRWLWAYSWGINQGFHEALQSPSYELKKLGTPLDPWEPHHTLAILLLQSFDQTRKSFENDIKEAEILAKDGEAGAKETNPEGLEWETTILKPSEYKATESASAPTKPLEMENLLAPASRLSPLFAKWVSDLPVVSDGSNNWVLSPSRSSTGRAWLANDPHLALKHPPFWYWAHISGGGLEAMGATLPGTPIIATGFNSQLAWGLTNSYMDVADVFLLPRHDLQLESFRPLIWIKFGPLQLPFFFKSLERTKQGWPVLPLETQDDQALILRWSGFDLAASDFEGLAGLARARSTQELNESLKKVGLPSWNYVFADTQQNIGYRAVGKIPKRTSPPPYGYLKNTSPWSESWSYLAPDEIPHLENPKRGFIATANNRQWPDAGPYFLGRAHAEGFRAWRIENLLLTQPQHDMKSLQKIQCDIYESDAEFFLPLLLRYLDTSKAWQRQYHQQFSNWDKLATEDCRLCAPYRRWFERLLASVSSDERRLFRVLSQDQNWLLRGQVISAFEQALKDLGLTPETTALKPWQAWHFAHFSHLGGKELFPALPLATPGGEYTVNPGTAKWMGAGWDHTQGPSQRLLVEMTSPPTVWFQLAGPNEDLENQNRSLKPSAWESWRSCDFTQVTLKVANTSTASAQKTKFVLE